MNYLITRLYQKLTGRTSTSATAPMPRPFSSSSANEAPSRVPSSAAVTAGGAALGSNQSSNAVPKGSGVLTQSPVEVSLSASHPDAQELQALLVRLMAKSSPSGCVQSLRHKGPLTDDEMQEILRAALEDPNKKALLRALSDRMERANQSSASSPVGGG